MIEGELEHPWILFLGSIAVRQDTARYSGKDEKASKRKSRRTDLDEIPGFVELLRMVCRWFWCRLGASTKEFGEVVHPSSSSCSEDGYCPYRPCHSTCDRLYDWRDQARDAFTATDGNG